MTRCIIRSFTAFGFRQAQDDRWKKRASEIYGRHRDYFGGNGPSPVASVALLPALATNSSLDCLLYASRPLGGRLL